MASWQKFNTFLLALGEKKHNLASDSFVLGLCAAANAPVAGNSVLANLTPIAYTNISSRALTTTSWTQSSGTSKLIIADKTLTVSGGPAAAWRYGFIYNDTAANDELVGFWDRGSEIPLADGEQYTFNFDDAGGLFTIGP